MKLFRDAAWIGLMTLCAGCSAPAAQRTRPETPEKNAAPTPADSRSPLAAAWDAFESSRYQRAESAFRKLIHGEHRGQALLGLSQVMLTTGRYSESAESARTAMSDRTARAQAAAIAGEALRRQGKLDEALAVLGEVQADPSARLARLLIGEIELERGRMDLAEKALMTLIEDYNEERIRADDGRSLAMVGRAAHLLRDPHSANDAFNEAERAVTGDILTLLWRAELFLEKYNPGDAEGVSREALAKAPNHPEALVWLAHAKLAEALDFDEAERLVKKALSINGKLAQAYFVLAGISLRDMELEAADAWCDKGLSINPRDLELLSMKATARYLADDAAGFSAAKARVLALNPKYSRMYNIIGEYADWEHRYEEIVQMMREALLIESDNAKARAQLGLNQIRAGDEAGGLLALQSAFKADPFNVRVFNTLNLYEKKIASEYVTVDQQRFKIRYHKDEKSILERYVPDLLDRAWSKMVKVYGFTPHTPTGIELYRDRESFSIRTSGLPHTAIQGVCFGKTLAAMSLGKEKFNLGMTLWHELAHVFHIQLSASHVPRWFTEGLAEYETLIARPEWTREYDAELYAAMRDGKLPVLASMSRAFTRAEQISDVAMAYYASSQIVVMLMERYGAPKVVKMLELWGKGKRHEQVFAEALGVSATELDRDFKAFLEQRFLRYKRQFVPLSRAGPLAQARADAKKAPRDASKHTIYALALMRARRVRQAARALDTALALDPKLPDANYLMAEVQLLRKNPASAKTILARLNSLGHDGFAVQMLLAEAAEAMEDKAGLRAALEAAHRFDPSKSEPINALAELAAEAKDAKGELEYLRKLALLEEHDGRSHRRLVRKLLDAGLLDEAMSAGEAALYADLSSLEGHVLFAEALIAKNQLGRAAYELESATLCEGKPGDIADAHARLAEILLKQGKRPAATVHAKRARELDPNNARVKSLPL